MIEAAVFDIGNVVCAFDPARRLRVLANETGLERARNTASARSVGLAAVTFTSATRLAADLDRHAGLRAPRPGSAATQVP